jgi:hypothetical protein
VLFKPKLIRQGPGHRLLFQMQTSMQNLLSCPAQHHKRR